MTIISINQLAYLGTVSYTYFNEGIIRRSISGVSMEIESIAHESISQNGGLFTFN